MVGSASSDRTALITGGSRGIGRALAAEFAANGYDLVLAARDPDRLAGAARALEREHGAGTTAYSVDLADPDAPEALFETVAADGTTIDALVNNAGIANYGRFAEIPLEDERRQLAVNVAAPVELAKLFLPGMLERDRGRIVTVASTSAFHPGPRMAGYHASKAYLVRFTESLAAELRGTGVTATALCPGPVATGVHERCGRGSSWLERRLMRSPEAVAADGYEAIEAGETVAIPGHRYRPIRWFSRLLPRRAVRWLAARIVDRGERTGGE